MNRSGYNTPGTADSKGRELTNTVNEIKMFINTMNLVKNTDERPGKRAPLVLGGLGNTSITDRVCEIAETPTPPRAWYIAFAISSSLTLMLFGLVGYPGQSHLKPPHFSNGSFRINGH